MNKKSLTERDIFRHFEKISEAPDAVERLRKFILDLAVRGKLVGQDPTDESAYRKAAEQGDPQAQCNLATIYKDGLGVRQDYATAVVWYRKAAEQGHSDAQFIRVSIRLWKRGSAGLYSVRNLVCMESTPALDPILAWYKSRVTIRHPVPPVLKGRSVVYWMQRAQLAHDNPALDLAVALGNALRLPVGVFLVGPPNANLRHYVF